MFRVTTVYTMAIAYFYTMLSVTLLSLYETGLWKFSHLMRWVERTRSNICRASALMT